MCILLTYKHTEPRLHIIQTEKRTYMEAVCNVGSLLKLNYFRNENFNFSLFFLIIFLLLLLHNI